MRLSVNGIEVQVAYLPFAEPASGAILQLLLQPSDGRDALHRKLVDELKNSYQPGVMDNAEVVDECTEIRLLNATSLEAVDLMRTLGYGVQEIHPH